jgi:hypothetical protein
MQKFVTRVAVKMHNCQRKWEASAESSEYNRLSVDVSNILQRTVHFDDLQLRQWLHHESESGIGVTDFTTPEGTILR